MSEADGERTKLDVRLWAAVLTAVLSGIGGSWYSFRTADEIEGKVVDRYHGRDAIRDFQLRDSKINFQNDRINRLRADFEEFKRNVPPKRVADALSDHEARIRAIEKQLYTRRTE